MNAPLYQLDAFGYPTAMALATLLGMAFGFVLERSGFGRSTVLAAQFYGRDMRVLKVMFSAIATTAVGLAVLGGAGVVSLAALQVPTTYLWPQVVGGLLLGVGFIVSGYCPGTAVVAAGSGYMDGLLSLFGVMIGALAFGFAYPALEGFYLSSDLGVVTLPGLLGVPFAVVAAAVVAMAVGSFLLAEKVERVFADRDAAAPPPGSRPARNRVFTGLAATAALGLAVLLLPAPRAEGRPAPPAEPVTASELGLLLAGGTEPLYVLDARAPAACEAARIPGALCLPEDDPDAAFLGQLPATRALVLYGAGDLDPLPAGVAAWKGPLRVLSGGWAAWEADVLTAPAVPEDPTPEAVAAWRLRSALHARFTGAAAPTAAPEVKVKAVKRERKKGGGC